jgi:exodeoxyribonuclease V gamma subunit
VPLGELLDVLDRTARVSTGADHPDGHGVSVRDRILVRHPLQPFDARNFTPSALQVGPEPFSFDRASYAGTRALVGERAPRSAFLPEPLPPHEESSDLVPVDSLVRFLEHPARHFLRQRLGLSAVDLEDETDDGFPVAPGPLERWAVGDRLLTAGLAGVSRAQAVLAERLRGDLPPGPLGTEVVEPIAEEVRGLVGRTRSLRTGTPAHVDVSVRLACGVSVTGTVPVFGDRVVRVVYSRLGAKHRLRAWVQLLALCAQDMDRSWAAVTVGRGDKGPDLAVSEVAGLPRTMALARLDELVTVYLTGLTTPLLVPPKTGCAYAAKRAAGVPVETALVFAGRTWRSGEGQRVQGECTDAAHRLVWGDVPLSGLLTDADPTDAAWPDEQHRFGQLARRVWNPLLDAETVRAL